MGLEAATFVNDLVTTNPVAGDNVSQGDDHLRLVKAVLKSTFPNLAFARYLEQDRVDLASATTPDLSTPASNYINLTGTTQIDGFATEPAGFARLLRFNAALTLNYNGTSFLLPSSDDIVTAAGDHALAVSLGSGNWRIVWYFRNTGRALVENTPPGTATESAEGLVEQATSAEIYASTAGAKALMAEDLATAADLITIADGATITPNWAAFNNGLITMSGNRTLNVPTNLKTFQTRLIWIQGNDGTDRTISLGAGYLGPNVAVWNALTFNNSGKRYLMPLIALNSSNAVFVGAPQGPF